MVEMTGGYLWVLPCGLALVVVLGCVAHSVINWRRREDGGADWRHET